MYKLAAAVVLLITSILRAGDGASQYLQGLDQIEAGKFGDAVEDFNAAIEENDENADYRIGLGVALTLAEKLPEAEKALARAIKLSNNTDEARLWMATAVAMQGDFDRGTEFYPYAVARNEYVNNIRRMSHEYGQAAFAVATAKRNGNNEWDVAYAKQELAKRDGIRKGFPRLGASFAQKMKAKLPAGQNRSNGKPDEQRGVSDALMNRIKQNIAKPDYVAALRDINPLLAGNNNDPQLLIYYGLCELNLGAPEIARRQFTRGLYRFPLDGELYALRAVAAARTGDLRRAKLDLDTAKSLNATRAAWAENEITAAPTATGEPASLLIGMFDAAKAGEPYATLLDRARDLILAQNTKRLRLDEDYIDRLREVQQAVNADPKNAEKLAAMAAFLYDNAVSPRGESVELRAEWRPYRPIDDAMVQAELTRALNVANEALTADAGNVSAMVTKAAVLVNRMQLGDAEQFLKKALDLAPEEPRLLRLFAEVADRAASAKQSQASSLRAPTTWEDQFYIYTRYPSAQERAQADALEAQANQLWAMARQALQQAIASAKEPAETAYFQAVLDRREGRYESALAFAKKAVELASTNLEYRDMVTTLLAQTGQRVEALISQAEATNLVQSTAGPMLKCVWLSLPRTKFKTSREYLAQAAKYDAADPRVPAYFGAVAGADEKTDVAAAWYAVSCALYEANARFEGVSADSKEPSPLRADVAATIMNVNLRAIALFRSARPADAEALARANLAMESRLDPSVLFTPVAASMLPDMDADQIPVPQADHIGYLLSVTRLELGRVLLIEKKYDEAIGEFEKVASYRERVPSTVDGGSKMQYPIKTANIYTVSAMLAKGDKSAARDRFRMIGQPRGLDAESVAEFERVSDIIMQGRSDDRRSEDDEAIRRQQEAMDAAMKERQRQIDEANRRRRGRGN